LSRPLPTRSAACALALLALLALAAPPCAEAQRNHQARLQAAAGQYVAAQKLRDELSQRPAAHRTEREYRRVIEAYRRVYHGAPTSPRANDSVAAVAELLTEMGRIFKSERHLTSAIAQYRFLVREYPGTRHRFAGIFEIARIQFQDLNQPEEARTTLDEFLRRFPRHSLAAEARAMLAALDQRGEDARQAAARQQAEEPAAAAAAAQPKQPAAAAPARPRPAGRLGVVSGIRHWSTPQYTRVAIDLEDEVKYEAGRVPNPDRIFFDLHDTRLTSELAGKEFEVSAGFLKKIRVAQFQPGVARVVLEVDDLAEYSAFLLPNPYRLIVDVHGKDTAKKTPASPPSRQAARPQEAVKATPAPTSGPTHDSVAPRAPAAQQAAAEPNGREARPTSSGEHSLIRALGLKVGRIVIDPGHGGHDTGTIGPSGLTEKELVLDVALRLGKLLEDHLGAEVIYTRQDDAFVPLETRTAIANQAQADLFISIHANSSPRNRAVRGVETYYLNFTSSREALEVAARENAMSESSIFELQDLVKKIALKEKIEESREFAAEVQRELHKGLAARNPGLPDRGVKKAPFIVLVGANMPSILAEVSFLSNPADEKRMRSTDYRQGMANYLFRGIASYAKGLSGIRVASSAPATTESGQ
jgi:N-acetylmuramoyl-L-alanine amidase